jgi:hypothetical protein
MLEFITPAIFHCVRLQREQPLHPTVSIVTGQLESVQKRNLVYQMAKKDFYHTTQFRSQLQ